MPVILIKRARTEIYSIARTILYRIWQFLNKLVGVVNVNVSFVKRLGLSRKIKVAAGSCVQKWFLLLLIYASLLQICIYVRYLHL